MAHHKIKIKKEFMQAKTSGDKPFEIRYNERGYQKGDTVTYLTDRPPECEYEGLWEITYVTAFEQKDNWVVFGDRRIDEKNQHQSGISYSKDMSPLSIYITAR